jgi:uncharacterized protein YdeI (BOF family)
MKLTKTLTVLALAAVMVAITIPALAQQSSTQAPQEQQQPQAQPAAPESQASSPAMVQTFQGTISRSDGKYVLTDSATGTSYKLDDEKQAKEFVGKSVKVTGALDDSSKTIHVATISPGS